MIFYWSAVRWNTLLEQISDQLRRSKNLLQLWQHYKALHAQSSTDIQKLEEQVEHLLKSATHRDITEQEVKVRIFWMHGRFASLLNICVYVSDTKVCNHQLVILTTVQLWNLCSKSHSVPLCKTGISLGPYGGWGICRVCPAAAGWVFRAAEATSGPLCHDSLPHRPPVTHSAVSNSWTCPPKTAVSARGSNDSDFIFYSQTLNFKQNIYIVFRHLF